MSEHGEAKKAVLKMLMVTEKFLVALSRKLDTRVCQHVTGKHKVRMPFTRALIQLNILGITSWIHCLIPLIRMVKYRAKCTTFNHTLCAFQHFSARLRCSSTVSYLQSPEYNLKDFQKFNQKTFPDVYDDFIRHTVAFYLVCSNSNINLSGEVPNNYWILLNVSLACFW